MSTPVPFTPITENGLLVTGIDIKSWYSLTISLKATQDQQISWGNISHAYDNGTVWLTSSLCSAKSSSYDYCIDQYNKSIDFVECPLSKDVSYNITLYDPYGF